MLFKGLPTTPVAVTIHHHNRTDDATLHSLLLVLAANRRYFLRSMMRLPFDDVAFEASERTEEAWRKYMIQESTLMVIGRFIVKHRGGGTPTVLSILKAGSFNAQF
ncbi:hypothetical protein G3M48_008811 [Beauveria asiatica]|uniref:Uncharacterized protein n=1 Tax=Beauveria asiatica TaxID=1069075 RepID=A0AAW0RK39_9HYPO